MTSRAHDRVRICLQMFLMLLLSSNLSAQTQPREGKSPPAPAASPGTSLLGQQQPGANPQIPVHLVLQGVPGAQQCPAPDWIKPGMRLTFLSASASVQGASGSTLEPDPNGNIEDSKGRRYREKSAAGGAGTGGAGYTVLDIIAVSPAAVVAESRAYVLTNGMQGPASLSTTTAMAFHPSGCDWYLHPAMLARLADTDTGTLQIMRHTYEVNGVHYNAIRITVEASGRTTYVYDLRTGVLLSHNSSATMSGIVFSPTSGDRGTISPNTGSNLAINRFVSARQLSLPWLNQQMPAWARTMKRARFEGAVIMKSPAHLGVQDVPFGLCVDVARTYLGENFTVYETTATQQTAGGMPPNPPAKNVLATGPASIGGMWMDPNVLRQLRTGQVLDQDPTVGVNVVVEYAGPGQDGRAIVMITGSNAIQKVSSAYDATDGRLIFVSKTDTFPETGFSNVTELRLTGME